MIETLIIPEDIVQDTDITQEPTEAWDSPDTILELVRLTMLLKNTSEEIPS